MDAARLIDEVKRHGGSLQLNGDKIRVSAPEPLPDNLRQELKARKPEVINFLKAGPRVNPCHPDWSDPEDTRSRFFELAGNHLSAGKTQDEADKLAFECLLADWMNSHPVEVTEGCPHCGEPHDASSMPYLNGEAGHIKIHEQCWPEWYAGLKKRASVTLTTLGIP